MGIETKLVKIGKIGKSIGRGICKYSTLGALIGASVLGSNAKAEISMKDILDAALGYDKPAVTQINYGYSDKTKTKAETKYNAEKEWMSYADCDFLGPRFDEGEVLEFFERQGEIVTREDFRSGANAYTEENGVLTINGAAGTGDRFGMDKRDGSQRVTAYFDPASLESGEGTITLELANDNPEDDRGISVSIFNIPPNQFTIKSAMYFDGQGYSLHDPIPYSGEEGLRLAKDNSGLTTVELNFEGVWYPVVSADVLAGTSCRASVIPVFYNSAWKPKMTGLTFDFEAPILPCDINRDGTVNSLDIQLAVNGILGYDISPYNADVNGDGVADAVDLQTEINAVLEYNP